MKNTWWRQVNLTASRFSYIFYGMSGFGRNPKRSRRSKNQVSGLVFRMVVSPVVCYRGTFFSIRHLPVISRRALPFYVLYPYRISGNPCRRDFPMQRYSVRPVVKHRCANQAPNWTAAFRKSKIWVFRQIPGCLLAFAILFPLLDPHVKSIPTR